MYSSAIDGLSGVAWDKKRGGSTGEKKGQICYVHCQLGGARRHILGHAVVPSWPQNFLSGGPCPPPYPLDAAPLDPTMCDVFSSNAVLQMTTPQVTV